MTIVQKMFFIIDVPFMVLRKITMPPAEEDKYNKHLTTIWPIPGFTFFAYGFGFLNMNFLYIGIPIAVVLTIILYVA